MRFDVCHVDDLEPGRAGEYAAAVVIDVIRAFTTASWCVLRGADGVRLAPTVAAALAAGRRTGALVVRDGRPEPGTDLPSAPGLLARTDLTGRSVVLKTGNGTRGAHAAAASGLVLCAAFSNAAATARALAAVDGPVLLVPTEGDEDVALAEFLVQGVERGRVEPAPYLRRVAASAAGRECAERGPDPAFPGVHPDDLRRCLQIDVLDRALVAVPDEDLLRLVPR